MLMLNTLVVVIVVNNVNVMIDKEKTQELKQLILDEINFRDEFRYAKDKIESLVSPITKHNRKCCLWWDKNLPDVNEIIVVMDNKTTLKLVKPVIEECSVESYLPYGVDFTECNIINVNK